MKKTLIILLLGIFLFSFVKADTSSFTIKFIIPSQNPTFDNLENYTSYVNQSFIRDINASDPDGISCFKLNDTSTFNIDCSGVITNITNLDTISIYWLNITVNDTLNYQTSEVFYIQIIEFDRLVIYIKPDEENTVPHIMLGRRLLFQ